MKIRDYEKSLKLPIRQATILLLLKNDKVLLAMKKRGFGEGKWNGVGGKPNPNEDIYDTAIRECEEEIKVTPVNPKKVAEINFYFPLVSKEKSFDQKVTVFIARNWKGDPEETEEMKPKWFKMEEVPYEKMWWDDKFWMPVVFDGKLLKASFMFGENDKVDDYYIDEVKSLT